MIQRKVPETLAPMYFPELCRAGIEELTPSEPTTSAAVRSKTTVA